MPRARNPLDFPATGPRTNSGPTARLAARRMQFRIVWGRERDSATAVSAVPEAPIGSPAGAALWPSTFAARSRLRISFARTATAFASLKTCSGAKLRELRTRCN